MFTVQEQVARVQRAHEEDESRLAAVMELLPRAFLFDYEGATTGDLVLIGFRPDPAFNPAGYEARIVHALAGTLVVDPRLKRMIDMHGVLAERVDFGYGLLGHVEKGGSFEIHRRQVSAEHWKTDLVEVHVQGKILMLKTVSKDQREARSDFRPVPDGTTLAEAKAMLSATTDQGTRARLRCHRRAQIGSVQTTGSRPATMPFLRGMPHALLRGRLLAHSSHGTKKEEHSRKQSKEDNAGNGNHQKLS